MVDPRTHRRLGILVDLPQIYVQALKRYRWNIVGVGRRLLRSLRHRYLPEEALVNGLLDPGVPLDAAESSVSRSEFSVLQHRLNPPQWETVLYDKGIFYKVCRAAGLPVPELYGLFFRDTSGWTAMGKAPRTSLEWEQYFLHDCPAEFIIKPCRSEYGSGITAAVRSDGRFMLHDGRSLDARTLVERVLLDSEFSSFVIQERLHNHPSLSVLGSGEGVHSLRLVTLVGTDGSARVICSDIKIIVGKNIVSNLSHGRHGNLFAEIDLPTGRLKMPRLIDMERGGHRPVSRHPDTGLPLEGFQISAWAEILDTAQRAARFFLPVRTVGWDIALSSNGPRILEGNIWYDPMWQGYQTAHWVEPFRAAAR